MKLPGRALPVPAMRKGRAVVGRGAHERQPQRDVDAALEGERLERDQGLVVIHGDDGIVAAPGLGVKQRVGGMGPRDGQACGRQLGDGRAR